jgi:anti-sigma B factor antagonist
MITQRRQMLIEPRAVTLKLVPHISNSGEERNFMRTLEDQVSDVRPCVVLDCSALDSPDKSAVHLMLCCLEMALKRNGDVRLAAVSPDAKKMLESVGADRLFRIFNSNAEAIMSFHRRAADFIALQQTSRDGRRASKNAA